MTRDDGGQDGGAPAGFLSAADVPAAVRAAVAAFEAPRGFEDFPTPTKNSAQRSLIYFYGRRMRRQQHDARPESKWFCLASAQCRANGTAISTTANISGCTRHLQVFHGLVSHKTMLMAKKAEQEAPVAAGRTGDAHDDARAIVVATPALPTTTIERARSAGNICESATWIDQDDTDGRRAARLDWTRVMVVRHLLPLAALVNDEQVASLMTTSPQVGGVGGNCERMEVAVLHHLVECYAATRDHLRQLVRREVTRATIPILHVGLLSASVPGSPASCGQLVDATNTLTLLVSFVTSSFRLQQFVLGVAHLNGVDSDPPAAVPGILRWIKDVLHRFGIAGVNVRSFVLEQSSPLSEPLAAALSAVDEAGNGGLGKHSVELSCDSVAVSALSAACALDSCLRELVTKLHAIAVAIVIASGIHQSSLHRMGIDAEPLEDLMSCLGNCTETNDISPGKLCVPSTWIAVGRALRWVVRHWQALDSMGAMTPNTPCEHNQPTPSASLDLSRADLQQSLAILQPVLDSLQGGLTTDHSRREKCAGCPEAVVNAFVVRLSALNELEPLQLVHSTTSDRGDDSCEDDANEESETLEVVRPADVTGFARKLRHELASRWDVATQRGVYRADNACLATFLHPCFRHLEFMDKARRSIILEQAKTLGRTVVINQRRRFETPVSTSISEASALPTSDHHEGGSSGNDHVRPLKKRKKTTKHERLAHQAEELARLGLLKMARSLPPLQEQSASSTASEEDPTNTCTANTALAMTCSSPAFLIANEVERYLQNESIAFQAVAFDETLTYWDRKAFEFPILAAVAQAVSGAPRSLRAVCRASSYAGRGGCCVRCCLRKCQHRKLTLSLSSSGTSAFNSGSRVSGRRLGEILHFLHLNEQFVPATTSIPQLSRESALRILADITESSNASVIDAVNM